MSCLLSLRVRSAVPASAVLLSVCLASCGSRGAPAPAAVVDGQPISYQALNSHAGYAASFYAANLGSPLSIGCSAATVRCRALRTQVLRRLIEETIILTYARIHHVSLDALQLAKVDQHLRELEASSGSVAELLARRTISTAFLRSLLETEAIVQKVEKVLFAASSRQGPSYHLRIVSFFIRPGKLGNGARRRATRFLRSAGTAPAKSATTIEWTARFRLPSIIRSSLDSSAPGSWIGPFRRGRTWADVQLLARGTHRYGRPARLLLQTRLFGAWIRDMVRKAQPRCYDSRGKEVRCPGENA